jgi:tricorn protease-like protein
MYRSNDSCCDDVTWVKPHLLVFVDDYKVKTLDPRTRHVVRIAGFSQIAVSHDGRLVAGFASSGGHEAETVAVVPIAGGRCRVVARRPDQDDFSPTFSRDDKALVFLRQRFDLKLGYTVGPARQVTVPLTALKSVNTC